LTTVDSVNPIVLRSHPMKRETKDVHIYFPVNVLQKLKKLAERNRRSVSAEIVIAVESHVGNDKKVNK
jgi:hypothetical protein